VDFRASGGPQTHVGDGTKEEDNANHRHSYLVSSRGNAVAAQSTSLTKNTAVLCRTKAREYTTTAEILTE
jgi:hypothetical protein